MNSPLKALAARIKLKIATVEHDEFLSPLEALEWCLYETERSLTQPPTTDTGPLHETERPSIDWLFGDAS